MSCRSILEVTSKVAPIDLLRGQLADNWIGGQMERERRRFKEREKVDIG